MPYGGTARVRVQGDCQLRLRVPAWNNGVSLRVNGAAGSPAAQEV